MRRDYQLALWYHRQGLPAWTPRSNVPCRTEWRVSIAYD
jgi:hypothetical protein